MVVLSNDKLDQYIKDLCGNIEITPRVRQRWRIARAFAVNDIPNYKDNMCNMSKSSELIGIITTNMLKLMAYILKYNPDKYVVKGVAEAMVAARKLREESRLSRAIDKIDVLFRGDLGRRIGMFNEPLAYKAKRETYIAEMNRWQVNVDKIWYYIEIMFPRFSKIVNSEKDLKEYANKFKFAGAGGDDGVSDDDFWDKKATSQVEEDQSALFAVLKIVKHPFFVVAALLVLVAVIILVVYFASAKAKFTPTWDSCVRVVKDITQPV
jgi:hypothetical protein